VADDPSWDEIFNSQPPTSGARPREGEPLLPRTEQSQTGQSQTAQGVPDAPRSRREARASQQHQSPPRRERSGKLDSHGIAVQKRKHKLTWLWVLISILAVLGGTTAAVFSAFEPQIRYLFGVQEPTDYTGSGTGRVVITIRDGEIGDDVAKELQKAGVTKTYTAFYSLLLKQTPQVQFQPGSYALKAKMSAQSALTALTDPKNKVLTQLVLPEGITVKGVVAKLSALSASIGVSTADIEAAVADYKSYGLPAEAPSLEGYLFPATYNLEPGKTAHEIIQNLVTQMFAHLDADGVPVADRHKILTLAALTQKEGGSNDDFLKVARVWDNRLAAGMRLESDATVSYGAGSTTINTTTAQRADKSNRYNTYANPGLPIGPISNPGDAAIRATLNPTPGNWLYFVVVNCSTGETAFSATFAQHQAAISQLGAWLKANPGGCN
jgi:UPF0755 protein